MRRIYPKYVYQPLREYNFNDKKKINKEYIVSATVVCSLCIIVAVVINTLL